MVYFKLGQADMAKALDIKGRNKAVAANLLPLLTLIGCIVYWVITKDTSPLSILLGVLAIIGMLLLGVKIQSDAVIESVYRCKAGKNRKIYQKNKHYFDKKFKKLGCNDRPRSKRHINEQQGGEKR